MCDHTVLPCGTSHKGTNVNKGSFVGYPSGEATYLLITSQVIRFGATTCSAYTNFDTYLRLYDSCPGLSHSNQNAGVSIIPNQLAAGIPGQLQANEQPEAQFFCSYLFYDALTPGTYWLVVEGAEPDPGAPRIPSLQDWMAVASSSDGIDLAAVAASGNVWTSIDAGNSWFEQGDTTTHKNYTSIASSADGTRLVASTLDGTLHVSDDSGRTFTETSINSNYNDAYLTDVASSDDGSKLAAVERNGDIWISSDHGASWYKSHPSPMCAPASELLVLVFWRVFRVMWHIGHVTHDSTAFSQYENTISPPTQTNSHTPTHTGRSSATRTSATSSGRVSPYRATATGSWPPKPAAASTFRPTSATAGTSARTTATGSTWRSRPTART